MMGREDASSCDRQHTIPVGHGALRTPKAPFALQPKPFGYSIGQTLPPRYRNATHGFLRNSFFIKRLLYTTVVLGIIDGCGITCMMYMQFVVDKRSAMFRAMNVDEMEKHDPTCLKWTWFSRTMYFSFPMVIFLGLAASGCRVFDLFKRSTGPSNNDDDDDDDGTPPTRGTLAHQQQRITTKVQRTWYLQVCEIVCVCLILFYVGAFGFVLITFVQSNFTLQLCHERVPFINSFVSILSWVGIGFQFTYFARLRDHLKMQLGAFKEGELTGGGRKPPVVGTPSKVDIQKRIFTAAELSDVDGLRHALGLARTYLGKEFAKELYGSASLGWVLNFSKKNPVHAAAAHGNLTMLQLLLDAGFSMNSLDKINRVRVSTGDLFWYLSQMLVRRAVVSADESAKHLFKTTLVSPLHCAVAASRVEAVRWLLDHGALVNQTARSSNREERLPPIFLCEHPSIMEMLLAANADHLCVPNAGRGSHTLTVLELSYLRGNYAVGVVLEDWGGDVALTPLHLAAASNDVVKVHKMLSYCDPNCLGEYGYAGFNRRTPLHWAAIAGSADVLAPLLNKGADPHAQDAGGRTPLHWAARANRVECVTILLEHRANVHARDVDGMTPVLCAALAPDLRPELLQALVLHGANINATVATGDTALHVAMKQGNRAAALALLGVGADINAVNGDGSRAIDCTTSTELQFAVKRAAGSRDVMISYTHSHSEFAKKLRASLEQQHITTWLDLMDPSGIGGGAVWREEIARGILNASCVVCVLTEDYPRSEWCLKELAYAKQVGTPVLAISTEHVTITEELQVYLYTRQIVPFESAISAVDAANPRNITYEYNQDQYLTQFRSLLDGVRDEIEKKRCVARPTLDMPTTAMATWGPTLLQHNYPPDHNDEYWKQPFVVLASGDCHQGFVRQVHQELTAASCRVYLDHPHGADTQSRISAAKEAILHCAVFVVVLSDKNQNELLLDQIAFAEDKGKPILPLLLSNPREYLGLGLQYTLSRIDVFHFAQNVGFASSMMHLLQGLDKHMHVPTTRRGYLSSTMARMTVPEDGDRWSYASDEAGSSGRIHRL
ncbi:hypothetical protein DYB31_004949 [Aphanomyces astaci]|uniref:TIR domain-containing protein n=1 Tax=Aphanomyces astaci TaxID=112090 RepID=A0A397FZP0_APHAT|nr:hypothetical protein DYB31_004949 [Aphanomyces astaci]